MRLMFMSFSFSAMAHNVNTIFGFDKEIGNHFIFIKEEHGVDASFLVGSLMWNALHSDAGLCLLSVHNSRNHYQHVGNKLGFNLKENQESGHAVVIDMTKCIVQSLNGDTDNVKIDFLSKNTDQECLHALYITLENSVFQLKEQYSCVYLVIDNISDLLSLGHSAKDIISFLYYCRALVFSIHGLTLVVCAHNSENDKDTNLICNAMMHIAEYKIKVSGLATGFSPNVTGRVETERREMCLEYLTEKKEFQYKLSDRQIKIFAPGTVTI